MCPTTSMYNCTLLRPHEEVIWVMFRRGMGGVRFADRVYRGNVIREKSYQGSALQRLVSFARSIDCMESFYSIVVYNDGRARMRSPGGYLRSTRERLESRREYVWISNPRSRRSVRRRPSVYHLYRGARMKKLFRNRVRGGEAGRYLQTGYQGVL